MIGRFLIRILIICLPLSARADLAQTSPDHRYVFGVHFKTPFNVYFLDFDNKIIWHESVPSVTDTLVATWSLDSRQVVFVSGEDRLSLECLDLSGSTPRYFGLDETALLNLGKKLCPYDWNPPGQGSIPHENIFELHALKKPGTFSGSYSRSAGHRRRSLSFILVLIRTGEQLVPAYLIQRDGVYVPLH